MSAIRTTPASLPLSFPWSGGGAAISGYTRAADKLLFDKMLVASSNSAASNSVLDGIKRLSETVGDPESGYSPAGMIGKFQTALQVYEQNPADQTLAQNAVQSAGDLVRSLNTATNIIQDVRKQADAGMADAVDRINNLLQQFKVANDAIVRGVWHGHRSHGIAWTRATRP